jgi:hypothetical protein
MTDKTEIQTWQDSAKNLMEVVRIQHEFVSNYVPNTISPEVEDEYMAITAQLASAIREMNKYIFEGDYDCLEQSQEV